MGDARQSLAERLLKQGTVAQRLAALPMLAAAATAQGRSCRALGELLAVHAAELVAQAAELREQDPQRGELALQSIRQALSAPALGPHSALALPDVPGMEALRLAMAERRLSSVEPQLRPLAALGVAQLERTVGYGLGALRRARSSVQQLREREGHRPSRALAEALNLLAVLEQEAGHTEAALGCAHESVGMHVELWRDHPRDRSAAAWACLTLGSCYYKADQPQLAKLYMREAVRLAQVDRDRGAEAASPLVGALSTAVTHFPARDVEQDLRELAVDARRLDDRALLAGARGWVLAAAGRHEHARLHLDEAVRLRRAELDAAPDRPTVLLVRELAALAWSLAASGRPLAAARALQEAAQLTADEMAGSRYRAGAVRRLCQAASAASADGEYERGQRLADEAIGLAEAGHDAVGLSLALACAALMAFDAGQRVVALELAARSAQVAQGAVAAGAAGAEEVRFAERTLRALQGEA